MKKMMIDIALLVLSVTVWTVCRIAVKVNHDFAWKTILVICAILNRTMHTVDGKLLKFRIGDRANISCLSATLGIEHRKGSGHSLMYIDVYYNPEEYLKSFQLGNKFYSKVSKWNYDQKANDYYWKTKVTG